MKDGSQIEVGTIGREGVSAIPLLLGAATTENESYCQVPGNCVKIEADLFQSLRKNEKFRQLLDRYVQAYVNMLGQLAACNRLYRVYEGRIHPKVHEAFEEVGFQPDDHVRPEPLEIVHLWTPLVALT